VTDSSFGYQAAFNIAFALLGILGGWMLKSLSERLRDLQIADTALTDKVQAIEVVVAGQYAKRDYLDERLDRLSTALFQKLDRIEEKLDGKADKS
jgi:hypothetical protein